MINNINELEDLIFDIVKTVTKLDDQAIIYANQATNYPSGNFVLLRYQLFTGRLTRANSRDGTKRHRIEVVCDVFGDQLLAAKLQGAERYCYFKNVLAIQKGSDIINLTELEAGSYLKRFNTSFMLYVDINNSVDIPDNAQNMGEFKIGVNK
jgi:hypothetical protein